MTVTLEGGDRVADGLRQVADDLSAGLDPVSQAMAALIAANVHPPRRTGALSATVRPIGRGVDATVTAGGPSVPYAAVHEWGWAPSNIRGLHYLTGAVQAIHGQLVDTLADGIQDRLDQL